MQTVIEQLKNSLTQAEAHADHMRNRIQASELDMQQATQYLKDDGKHIEELRKAIAILEAGAHSPGARVAGIPLLAQ